MKLYQIGPMFENETLEALKKYSGRFIMLKYFSIGFGIAGVILGLFACAPKPKVEDSCNFVQNVYGQRISWKDQVPIPLFIHADFPKQFIPALEKAMKVWETSAGHKLFTIINNNYRDNSTPEKDGKSVVYWLKAWEAEKPSEQARTSIYWVGDQIREADLRVNAKNFSYYLDTPQSDKQVHLESLLIHELGHVLGLKHNDAGESVMATYLALDFKRDVLSKDDQKAMVCEYK